MYVINIKDYYDADKHFIYNLFRKYSFINLLLISIITFFYLTSSFEDGNWNITCYYKIIWLTTLPYTFFSFLGLIYYKIKPSQKNKYMYGKTLYIVLVTKGTNPDTVLRTI